MEGEKSRGCEEERKKKEPEMWICVGGRWGFVPARQTFWASLWSHPEVEQQAWNQRIGGRGREGRGEERGEGGNNIFSSFRTLFAEKGDVFSNNMPDKSFVRSWLY